MLLALIAAPAASLLLAVHAVHAEGPLPPLLQNRAAPDGELDLLFDALRSATSEEEGRAVEDAIWRIWTTAPDPGTQRLMDKVMDRRSDYDFAGARAILDDVVKAAPAYAEGFNQRAFIRFLQEDYDGALSDLEVALSIEPRHFAAMAGQAMILMRQGRFDTVQKILKEAAAIHPYLKERSLIVPDAGTDAPSGGEPADIEL